MLPGAKLGQRSTLLGCSLASVGESFPPETVWVGSPARSFDLF